MPASLAPAEPSVRQFDAAVVARDGREVTLGETYFYPASGGQPADRGVIAGTEVVDVAERDGEVVHVLAEEPAVDVGETVACTIDDGFRTYCARAHSASHVLYGAGRRLFEDLGYGGFDIGEQKIRVDLATPTEIGDETLVKLERLTNRAVWESRPVSWEEVPVEDARERDEVAFNTKTEEGVMDDADAVRIVTVEDWDVAACGGTHVENTREIGPVEVLERSNPGEGLTRVEFAVGPTAVDHRASVHAAARSAASALDVGVDDLADAATRIRSERDELRAERDELTGELLDARLADLPRTERDGATWRAGTVAGFGPNDVGEAAQTAVAEGEVIAAAGRDGATFVVVAADAAAVDAGAVVDEVTDEFGGGGGGSPSFAQGGGIDADPEAVSALLRD